MPEFSSTNSMVPPCAAETLGTSPPSVPPREDVDLDLAAGLGGHQFGELARAHLQRVALGVLQRQLEGLVLRLRGAADQCECGGDHERLHQCRTFH
jgi:hypothetical protein